MFHRFATYEEAALFVAKKRSDGFGAEILNDNASSFWGPITSGGVRVWISDGSVEEGEELPEAELEPFKLPDELGKGVAIACLSTIAIVVGLLLLALPAIIVAVVILVALVAVWLFLMAVLGVGLSEWVKAVRDPDSKYHELAIAVVAFIAAMLFFLILLSGGNVGLGA